MQLEFIVENQRLTRTDKNFVVEKSQNYLYAHFDFKTNDWNRAISRYAIFTNDNYNDNNDNSLMVELQDNNTCLVPHTILLDSCSFKVNLVGTDSSGNFILTTNVSNVSVNKTGSTSGISPDDPQPSILVELLEKVNKSYSNFNFEYNEENGKLLLELIDNDKVVYSKEVDLPMEQVVKNVKYDNNTKILTIEWVNGQSTKIDFSKFTDTYLGDEKTIHLENNVFSIKKEWLDEINNRLNSTINIEIGDERYLKKESAIIEEHEISEPFYERMTASDSTGSKYEIENGSLAKVKYLSGMSYKSENLLVFEDVEETTVNGLTYSAKNGIIYINGTTTAITYIKIPCKLIGVGTYTSKILEYKENGVATDTFKLTIQFRDSNGEFIVAMYDNYKQTLNITNDLGAIWVSFASGLTYNNVSFGTMVVSGTTAPTEYKQGYEGIRNTAVTEIKSVGNNLLNNDLLDSYDSSATKQNDNSFISKSLGNYGAIILNGKYQSTFGEVRSLNGIELSKGTYYISFKAKLNSGTSSNINTVFITRENSTQINTTSVYKPTTITSEYQTYKRSFELTENDKIGITIQVPNNVSSAIIQVKDIMISKDDIEYQPYWEETLKIPESVTSLEGYGDGLSKTDLSRTNYVDFERDKFVQNTQQITLNGTESGWYRYMNAIASGEVWHFVLPLTNNANATDTTRYFFINSSNELKNAQSWNVTTAYDKTLLVANNRIMLRYDEFTTVDEIKSYLQANPITIEYLLATPIETDIDLVDRTYKVDNLGTETLVNEYNQKAFASIEYGVSLKSQIIENSENIANLKLTTEQHEERIDDLENEKLDKKTNTTINHQAYVKNNNGTQSMISVSDNDDSYAIAQRNGNGKFQVGSTEATDKPNTVVSKDYVDNLKNIVNKQAQRIKQLELASEGTILSTYENVSEVTYNRLIGENVLPYGTLDKVGGMTYKSENILNMPEYSATTGGVKITVSGNEISFVGTPTSQFISFGASSPLITLPKGSYIMKAYDLPVGYEYRMMDIQNRSDYVLQNNIVCVIPNEMTLIGILNVPTDVVNTTAINITIKIFISREVNYINFTPISNSEYNLTKNVLTVNSLTTDSLVLSSNTITLKAGAYNCTFIHWFKSQPTSFNALIEVVNQTGTVISSRTPEYKGYQQVLPVRFTLTDTVTLYIRITITCENLQNWDCRMSLYDRDYVSAIEYKPYYSETGLRNTAVSEVISNGANLISSEFVFGGFDNNSGNLTIGTVAGTTIVTKDYIKVLPNTTYTFSISENKTCYVGEYDKDYNYLGLNNKQKTNTFTTKSNTAYIRLKIWSSEGTTLENATNRMLNYGSEAKPYKPYKAPIHYAVPPEVQALQGYGLGINETYNNYIDYDRKVFVKKGEIITLNGTETQWNIKTSNGVSRFNCENVLNKIGKCNTNASKVQQICSWVDATATETYLGTIGLAVHGYNIYIYNNNLATVDDLKAWLSENPITIVYELETPVETDISQYLTEDNVIEMEANGSLTFENEHQQAVPNAITYQERNV